VVGIFVAPSSIPLVFAILGGGFSDFVFKFSLVASYGSMLIFGIPAILVLKKSNRHSIVWLVFSGIICGIVAFGIFLLALLALITGVIVPDMNSLMEIIPGALWWGSLFGIVVSTLYGLISNAKFRQTAT
jgi:membrane associated rhomboid family serine protease